MAKNVFISHKEQDRDVAARVCTMLEQAGVSCWIAPRDLTPGKEWADSIVEALQASRAFVLLLSAACAQTPKQLCREIEIADRLGLPILTMRIENVEPPPSLLYFLDAVQWLNAFDDQLEPGVSRLISLVRESDRTTEPPVKTEHMPPPALPLMLRRSPKRSSWRPSLFEGVAACVLASALLAGTYYSENTHKQTAALAQVDQARKYFKSGEPGSALAAYNKAIRIDKKCYMAYCSRATLLLNAGEEDRALADVNTAIRINPNWPVAFRVRGDIHASLEQYRAAIDDYTAAIAINSADPRGISNIVQAYQGRADAHRRLNEIQLANKDLKSAVRLSAVSQPAPALDILAKN